VRRTSNSAAGAGGRGQAWLQPGRTYTVVIAIASGAEQPAPSTADRATAFATEQAPTRGCLSQPQRTRSGSAADLPAECSFPMDARASSEPRMTVRFRPSQQRGGRARRLLPSGERSSANRRGASGHRPAPMHGKHNGRKPPRCRRSRETGVTNRAPQPGAAPCSDLNAIISVGEHPGQT
jgi:hypothetical protein